MVKHVTLERFRTSDGMLFDTQAMAERHEAVMGTLTVLETSNLAQRLPTVGLIEIAEFMVDHSDRLAPVLGRLNPA